MLFNTNELSIIKKNIYSSPGYYIVKNFLDTKRTELIRKNWQTNISHNFHEFIKNTHIKPGSPKYVYNKPTMDDFSYCTQIWNRPIDEALHESSYLIQMMRNQIEGHPLYYGLHESTGMALQYRVCKTISPDKVVKQHADFFQEYRPDPTGDHTFDPTRIQATLILSDYGKDYDEGGFKLWNEEKTHYQIFGKDIKLNKGDLIYWRYSIPHEVSDVNTLSSFGFLRVIYPLFDINRE